jgi:hypothetical protein
MELKYASQDTYRALEQYAKKNGLELTFDEREYPEHFMSSRTFKYRLEASIASTNKESFYASLYDTYHREGEETQFSGVFLPVDLSEGVSFTVKKRDEIDKVFAIFKDKSFKTKNRTFNSKVVVKGNDEVTMSKILSDLQVQKVILRAFELRPTMVISLNYLKVSFVEGLKNKSNMGIHDRQWFKKDKEIDVLFNLINQLNRTIRSK